LKKILRPGPDFLGVSENDFWNKFHLIKKIEIVFRLKLLFLTTIFLKNINSHTTENKNNLGSFSKKFSGKYFKINNLYNQYSNFKIIILTRVLGEKILFFFLII